MQLEAAKQSMGITLLPCFIADKEPTLVRVPKCEPEIKHDIWMLSKSEQREVARLRAFKERLIDDFNSKQMKERLLGNWLVTDGLELEYFLKVLYGHTLIATTVDRCKTQLE